MIKMGVGGAGGANLQPASKRARTGVVLMVTRAPPLCIHTTVEVFKRLFVAANVIPLRPDMSPLSFHSLIYSRILMAANLD